MPLYNIKTLATVSKIYQLEYEVYANSEQEAKKQLSNENLISENFYDTKSNEKILNITQI